MFQFIQGEYKIVNLSKAAKPHPVNLFYSGLPKGVRKVGSSSQKKSAVHRFRSPFHHLVEERHKNSDSILSRPYL